MKASSDDRLKSAKRMADVEDKKLDQELKMHEDNRVDGDRDRELKSQDLEIRKIEAETAKLIAETTAKSQKAQSDLMMMMMKNLSEKNKKEEE